MIAKFGRAFGTDAETVTAYDGAFIAAHHEAGLVTALKHFPGHGSSTADSHEGFVDITGTWSDQELDPYRALFADGYADLVMVGHLYHADYADAGTQTPASLSPQWITGVLRDDLGFKGVVISDDLEMGAIREHFSLQETVTMARARRHGRAAVLQYRQISRRPRRRDSRYPGHRSQGRSGFRRPHRGKLQPHRRPQGAAEVANHAGQGVASGSPLLPEPSLRL